MRRFLAFVLILAATTGLPVRQANACSLSLGWEVFEPFQLQDGDSAGGLDVTLFQEAAKEVGCSVTTQQVPWRRLLGDLEKGRTDAAMGATATPERETFAWFSEPYRDDEFVLFLRKGEAAKLGPKGIGAIADAGLRLGVVGGYEYGAAYDAAAENPAFAELVDAAPDTRLNLRKLLINRIDAFIENRFVGLAVLRQENAVGKVDIHPTPVSTDPVVFMFSKASVSEDVVKRFNAALAAMKADGRFDAIAAQYLN